MNIYMNAKVDMTYSFLQDDEPTDEQLFVIMQEVAEDARLMREKVAKQVIENIKNEYERIRSDLQFQQI